MQVFSSKSPVWVPKVTVGLFWTQKWTFAFYLNQSFLKCIHSKISCLCSKGYSQISYVPNGHSRISLIQNVVFTKIAAWGFQWFLSTCFYYHSFSGPFLDLNGTLRLYLAQNIVVTPRTQSMSSTHGNRHTPIKRALQVCQALQTDSKNNILDIKSPN